jgi:hypothetical protein
MTGDSRWQKRGTTAAGSYLVDENFVSVHVLHDLLHPLGDGFLGLHGSGLGDLVRGERNRTEKEKRRRQRANSG